jgi:NAD(P)-dependent dehydrogenase (short-subunit alcohol dehydrogenase family)
VNAIAPGPTACHLLLDGKPQAAIDHLSHLAPLERLGTPDDIAAAVSFLPGPDGSWINGQVCGPMAVSSDGRATRWRQETHVPSPAQSIAPRTVV